MAICPVCNRENQKLYICRVNLLYDTDFDLVECSLCKVIHYDPVPTDEQLGIFYSSGGYEFDRWKLEAKARFFSRKLLKRKRAGRFLDVGCASGYFINGIKKYSGWDVSSVDIGDRPTRFAREVLGLDDVRTTDILKAGFPDNYFDFIHINDVLEHVRNPVDVLKECKRIIRNDGTLYLSIPNGANDCKDLIDFYKEMKRPGRQHSGHIFFFPKESLLWLFNETGFEIGFAKTFHIRKGLRKKGLFPKKNGWTNTYEPSHEPERPFEGELPILEEKKHSDLYQDIQMYKKNFFRLPGLSNLGLNFQFLLTPKK